MNIEMGDFLKKAGVDINEVAKECEKAQKQQSSENELTLTDTENRETE